LKRQFHTRDSAPNFTLKLVRPGFGPAAELPTYPKRDGVTPLAVRHSVHARHRRQAARLSGFDTWAMAAQLSR
jgi:hypothetical protein